MSDLILVVGGARSGKSAYAQELAGAYQNVAYLATATAGDEEMSRRIAHHRRQRPARWLTVEEPLDLTGAIEKLNNTVDVIIIDCLTLYLNNFIYNTDFKPDNTENHAECERLLNLELDKLINATKRIKPALIAVSNELGTGLVPADPLSRFFRDLSGLMNQKMAYAAACVYKLEVGIPVRLK